MGTFVVTYSREQDHVRVRDQLEKQGGFICGIIRIPFWNYKKQITSTQYACVYQAECEIDVEVLT
jgi:hypothetical protein